MRQSPRTAFKGSYPLLEDVRRRVHDAGVNIAELFQAEEISGMFRITELIARSLIDGHRACARRGVWLLASVERFGSEFHGLGSLGGCYHSYD